MNEKRASDLYDRALQVLSYVLVFLSIVYAQAQDWSFLESLGFVLGASVLAGGSLGWLRAWLRARRGVIR